MKTNDTFFNESTVSKGNVSSVEPSQREIQMFSAGRVSGVSYRSLGLVLGGLGVGLALGGMYFCRNKE